MCSQGSLTRANRQIMQWRERKCAAFLSARSTSCRRSFAWSSLLRSVEELSVEETADSLAISQETVRTRYFRAKGMLRESLAKEVDFAEGDIFHFGGMHCDCIVATVLARLAT
jgi:DNA-directed RNA polymerase specialized sigma24 family protein